MSGLGSATVQASESHKDSSSSDSSEDEEEAKKIAAAVGDSSIAQLYNGAVSTTARATEKADAVVKESTSVCSQARKNAANTLKSNRPVDINDEDKDNFLHTTPEFRSYIGKQLYQMLEKKLSDSFVDGMWKSPRKAEDSDKGIRLFSDSKELFKMQTSQPAKANEQNFTPSRKKEQKRKVSISSTSSDSSDDELIKSCVVTVGDIHKENERLSGIEVITGTIVTGLPGQKRDTAKEIEKAVNGCGSGKSTDGENKSVQDSDRLDPPAAKKKKKQKKKKQKTTESKQT